MRCFGTLGCSVAIVMGLWACGGQEAPPPLLQFDASPTPTADGPPPPASIPDGLPDGWFVASNDGKGMMLEKLDDEDAWIWITVQQANSGANLEEAVANHREAVESSPAGRYEDNGPAVNTTSGTAMWSLGFYEPDEGEEDGRYELALFLPYPARDGVLRLLYLYPPGGPEMDSRLRELVAVVEGLRHES